MESRKNNIIFNPFFNRHPQNGIEVKQDIFLDVQFPNHFNVWDITLIIEDDNGKIVKEIPFINQITFQLEKPGLYWYCFTFCDCYGKHYLVSDEALDAVIYDNHERLWQLTVYESFPEVSWFRGSTMYQIMVDRFFREGNTPIRDDIVLHQHWDEMPLYEFKDKTTYNNDFFGGNIQGIIAKLPYLKSLNVNVLYLNPIFEAFSNHKYDTGDYMKIDSMFGTEEDFVALCEKANKLGIAIILDGVFNHTGDRSIYFNKYNTYPTLGAYQSKESPYYDWYQFTKHPNYYKSWWGITSLPSVNQHNQAFLTFINQVITKWISKGAKGFRLDVVDELNNDFVRQIRKTMKSIDESSLLIGEVWEDASNKVAYGIRKAYFDGTQLDSVMNYVWKDAILHYVATHKPYRLRNAIRSIITHYPKQVLDSLMNILDTHDTIRLMNNFCGYHPHSKHQAAIYKMPQETYQKALVKVKMASLLQYTLPGNPCIYYGDEVGLDGFKDPFNRRTFPWGAIDEALLQWYQKLGKIRNHPCFKDGVYNEWRIDHQFFAFTRSTNDTSVLIVINHSHKMQSLDIIGFDLILETNITYLDLQPFTGTIIQLVK